MTQLHTKADLLLEIADFTDNSGDYLTDWVDRQHFNLLQLVIAFNNGSSYTVALEEGMYDGDSDPFVMRSTPVTITNQKGFVQVPVTAGLFRVRVNSNETDNPLVRLAVRGL